MAQLRQDCGRAAELGLGQAHVAHEGMQVPHQRDHDLAKTRVAGPRHRLNHRFGDVLLALDDQLGISMGAAPRQPALTDWRPI